MLKLRPEHVTALQTMASKYGLDAQTLLNSMLSSGIMYAQKIDESPVAALLQKHTDKIDPNNTSHNPLTLDIQKHESRIAAAPASPAPDQMTVAVLATLLAELPEPVRQLPIQLRLEKYRGPLSLLQLIWIDIPGLDPQDYALALVGK